MKIVLHRAVRRVLLFGSHLNLGQCPPTAEPPRALRPVIDAVRDDRKRFDELATDLGDRYRSGFWAIYLLSAVAVLCAVLPLALGWDDTRHVLHPFVGIWAIGEVLIICLVGSIYWLGRRRDWQGRWLQARTTAELIGYVPVLAPLVDFQGPNADADWYLRVFDPGQNLRGSEEVAALCRRCEVFAREQLTRAWADPEFVASYARWAASVFAAQAHYHGSVESEQKALQHRVHGLTTWLFAFTALGALAHLLVHSLWLSLATTFFPALGASLHGALAQSEAYRLQMASGHLAKDLSLAVERINHAIRPGNSAEAARETKISVEAALSMILEEHQDWHMLVTPHRLPLA